MARLKETYRNDVVPALVKQFGDKSVMEVPRLQKIVLNMGVGEAIGDKKLLENAAILEAKNSAQLAEWNSKVAEAQSKARAREAELQQAIDKQREEAADAIESIRQQGALLSVARLDADRLRKQAGAYAAGRGASDSISACQARTNRLGALLADGAVLRDEGQDLVAACAFRADERAVKLSACLKGWPSQSAPTH